MTKKDYIKFAELFGKIGTLHNIDKNTLDYIVRDVSDLFFHDNLQFDYDRFYAWIAKTANKLSTITK